MKISKMVAVMTFALAAAGLVFAQEDSFDSDDSFGSFGFDDSSESGTSIETYGTFTTNVRAYLDNGVDDTRDEEEKVTDKGNYNVKEFTDLKDMNIDGNVKAKLGVKYSGNGADGDLTLRFDKDIMENHPADIIDELKLTGYFGNLTVNAGKMKITWGKGDKLHVIDNFNADDYSDFIIPDYIDRRLATPMFQAVYGSPYSGNYISDIKIEGVFTPFLPTDRFASSGYWVPNKVKTLTSTLEGAVKTNLGIYKLKNDSAAAAAFAADSTKLAAYSSASTDYITYLNYASSLSADDLYPDTNTLKYSQAGLRFTATTGRFDWGLSYYYGHYKQPSVDLSGYIASYLKRKAEGVTSQTLYELPEFNYDRKQTFGLEMATILWHFNLRAEGGFNLTEDIDGDNPWVHNNSIGWVAGFDIDLPINNLNINVQETGTYTLGYDKIDKATNPYKAYDVDYNYGHATNNKIVVNITDNFMLEKISTDLTVLYGIERKDLVVQPKITFKPAPDFKLILSGAYIWCKDEESEFYGWDNNSFANVGVQVAF